MYMKCVDAGACTAPSNILHYSDSQYANHPVVYVNWNQASSYCTWVGRELPTEAQWEKASRGIDVRTYPWGNVTPTCSLANYSGCKGDTTIVGSYETGKSPYGVYDMAGNVWEWVQDWYGTYPSGTITNPSGPDIGEYRVLRGGSWENNADYIRSAFRFKSYPSSSSPFIGFRCALT
jgi:formylglycine-generating enzyme required for sulfatase activity